MFQKALTRRDTLNFINIKTFSFTSGFKSTGAFKISPNNFQLSQTGFGSIHCTVISEKGWRFSDIHSKDADWKDSSHRIADIYKVQTNRIYRVYKWFCKK